ncbi:MAG: type II secretion system F family protein [Candidatus Micrarchaeia archaeon]
MANAKETEEIIAYAKRIRRLLVHFPLARAIEICASSKDRLGSTLREFANRQKLGASSYEDLAGGSPDLSELLQLLKAGLSGSSISKKLDLFVNRLETIERFRNRIHSKTAGTLLLMRMGLVVFFPLFSGISAAILKTQMPQFGVAKFAVLVAAYLLLMHFISSSFAYLESSMRKVAYRTFAYWFASIAVFLATYSTIGFAI